MASRTQAEEALYGAIAHAAKGTERDQDGAKLKALAEAFKDVAYGSYGPQGGVYEAEQSTATTHEGRTVSESKQSYSGTSQTDYHETHHRDDSRPAPGFGDRES